MLRKLADLLKTVALAEIEVEKVRISLSKIISPNLKEIPFELLDERKRGFITSLELSRFFEKHKIETTQDEVRMIIEYYDLKRQGKLSLEDFHKALAPRTKPPQDQKKKEEGKPKRLEDEIINFFVQELEFVRKTHMLRVHLHGTVASNSFDFYNAINKDQEKAEFTFHDFDDFLQNQGIIFSKEEIQAIMNRGDRDGKHEVSYVEFERYILPDVVNKKVNPRPEPEYMYNTIVENYRVNKAYDKEQIRKDLKQEGLSFHTPFDQYERPSTFSPENPLLFQPIPTSSHTNTGYFNHLDKYHRPTRNHYSSLNDDYKRTKSSYLTGTNILATTYSSTKQRPSYDRPSYNNRPSFEKSSYQRPSFERPSYNSSVPANNYRSNATVTSNLSSISSKYEKAYSYLTKDRDRFDELSSLSVSAVPSLTSTYEKAYPFATRERPFYVQPYHYKRYPYTTPYYPDQYYQSHRARPKRSQSVPYPHNMYGSNSTAVLGAGYKPYHAERRFETPMKYSDQMGIDHSPEYKRNYSNGKYPISGPQPSNYYKVYDRFPADCYMLTKEADSKFKNEGAPPVTTYNHGEPSFLNAYSSVRSNERSRSAQSFFVKGQNNEKLMRESNSFKQSNGFRATDAMKRANAWLNRDQADLARTSKLNVGTGTRTYQPDLARTAKYGSHGNSYQPSQRVQDLTRSRRLY